MKTESFIFNGHEATVIIPHNPNGKCIWKTEFFYAFDKAEQVLCDMGFTRVYYAISDLYGSVKAVRLMRAFHKFLVKKYDFLTENPALFGFSRGGLYAFNYALFYPESVSKIYLDAPVLNLKSWPPEDSRDQEMFFEEYNLNKQSFLTFRNSPIDNLEEFFSNGIPIMVVAGDSDELVPYNENGRVLVDFYRQKGVKVKTIIKQGCGHHPHSLDDVSPIIDFICY